MTYYKLIAVDFKTETENQIRAIITEHAEVNGLDYFAKEGLRYLGESDDAIESYGLYLKQIEKFKKWGRMYADGELTLEQLTALMQRVQHTS